MISDPAFFMPNFFSILTLGSGKCKHNFFAHLFKMTYLVLTKNQIVIVSNQNLNFNSFRKIITIGIFYF